MTANRLPYFVRLGDNVLSASGYSGQGVALATLGGQLLADFLKCKCRTRQVGQRRGRAPVRH